MKKRNNATVYLRSRAEIKRESHEKGWPQYKMVAHQCVWGIFFLDSILPTELRRALNTGALDISKALVYRCIHQL